MKARVVLQHNGILRLALEDGRVLRMTYAQADKIHRGLARGFVERGSFDAHGKFHVEYIDGEYTDLYSVPTGKEIVPYVPQQCSQTS